MPFKILCMDEKETIHFHNAGLRWGNSSDLNSACFKVLVIIKNISVLRRAQRNSFAKHFSTGHNIRPIQSNILKKKSNYLVVPSTVEFNNIIKSVRNCLSSEE